MLDLKWIRQNPDLVRKAIEQKNLKLDLDALLRADQRVVQLLRERQRLEEQKNANAKEVPRAKPEEKAVLIQKGREIGASLEKLRPDLVAAEAELQTYLWLVPMIPSKDAPVGKSDAENLEIKRWGEARAFGFKPRDHVELMQLNGWGDFERIARVAGTRSYALKNELVLLELGLHQWTLRHLQAKGFELITVPAMAREFAFYGTGHFPMGRDQAYALGDDLYLTGTAEVAANALHAGEILNEADLPIRYAAYSPCFRSEAGSSGKDTRGLIRVHQFMKVEQFILCKNAPAESAHWHQELLKVSEELVQKLELPYRVVDVCTGDMGPGKFRQFDIEAWVPSENRYRETHSCSALHDWQARRTGLRYRDRNGVVQFCHTLNNTAIATPRILVPLLENHQLEDGTIRLPRWLQNH